MTPVDYTSRDYWSLRQDLISAVRTRIPDWQGSNENDFLVTILESFAFMGDILSYYTDRIANEAFLPTATQRQSLMNIADTYGYLPSGRLSAVASLQVTYQSATLGDAITVPELTQIRGVYNLAGESQEVIFETISDLVVTTAGTADPDTAMYTGTGIVTVVHGETVKDTGEQTSGAPIGTLLGVSDGSPNQEFLIEDANLVQGSTRVWVHESLANGREYFNVRYLADGIPKSRVYRVRQYANGMSSIQFGDGSSGVIPASGTQIRAQYRTGGGTAGNVPVGVLDSLVNGDLDISVTNISVGTGGAEVESNDSIRANAASALRVRNRVVLLSDAEDMAKIVSGVSQAKAVGSSMSNMAVYILPVSGPDDTSPGFISGVETSAFTTLKSDVHLYLSNAVPYGTTVAILSPVYVPLAIELSVFLPDGVRKSEAQDAVRLALTDQYSLGAYGFGSTLYPADIYATVSGIDLVRSLQITNFQRTDTMAPGSSAVSDPIYGAAHELFYLDASYPVISLYGGINDIA